MTSEARTEALRKQLAELYGLSCVPMWGTPRNPDRATYGGRVAKIARILGTPLMPWQRYVADVALEVDPETGLLAYRHVLLMVPRQSGKTTLLLALMVWRANAWQKQNILYAAQKRQAARKKFEEEHVATLKECKALAGKFTVRMTNGDESIRWIRTRSRHGITANGETSGHGETLDLGVLDEAFAHEDGRMEQAFSPAMITRPQPQQWVVSTAGTAKSAFLNDKREIGRKAVEAGLPTRIAVFDWTAPDDANPHEPETWWATMPALGHTVTEAAVSAERDSMPLKDFKRAYLNITNLDEIEDDPNVPTEQWPALADAKSQPGDRIVVAADIAPNRSSAAIAVCGMREDGRHHVEIIEHRDGTDWLLPRLLQVITTHKPLAVALDAIGPTGTLLTPLQQAGLHTPADAAAPEKGDLAVPTAREVAAACGAWTDACRQDTLRHLDQAPLNAALAGARSRPLGDAYAWSRKGSSSDISPLIAATIARWGYETRAHLITDDDYDPVANFW